MGFKAIYPEKHGTPAASSADANYPATNLTANKKNKKVWMAESGVNVATLRIPISSDADESADGFGLTNTNALSAIAAVTLDSNEQTLNNAAAVDEGGGDVGIPLTGHGRSEGDVVLINGTNNYGGVYTLPAQTKGDANKIIIEATYTAETFEGTETLCVVINSSTYTLNPGARTYRQLWHEYTAQTAAHKVTIILTAASGVTVQAGILRAGVMVTLLRNPSYGISKVPHDYSIKKEYADGSRSGRKRDIVREFGITLKPSEDEFEDLYDLYEEYGPDPIMMLVVDGVNDLKWTVFGYIEGLGGKYEIAHVPTNFTVLEAV